jgi:phage regulator Rha-like protein
MSKELTMIQNMIYEIRGFQVMLDEDLAKIYHVETRAMNQAVKRNLNRFPPEFMFQLTQTEYDNLRSQSVISKDGRGGRRYMPYVFTEHGVIMLSSVLNSNIATQINISIVKAFIKMRRYLIPQKSKSTQIAELRKLLMLHIDNTERKFSEQDKLNKQIALVLNSLIEKPPKTKKIGFNTD